MADCICNHKYTLQFAIVVLSRIRCEQRVILSLAPIGDQVEDIQAGVFGNDQQPNAIGFSYT